jgi:thiamine monophosphate synthase
MSIIGITNRKLCVDFYEQIRKISKSNLNYLIIREKDLNYDELLALVLQIKEELKNTDIKIIVNSSIDVAKKTNSDGIQLSFSNFIDIRKKLYTENMISLRKEVDNSEDRGNKYKVYKMVGVSIHSYEEGIEAYKLGADYVIYGHIFQTDCKKNILPRGVREIEALSKKINIPIVGLGGINQNNFQEVLNSGAKGIAIMSSLMKSENPKVLIESFSK